MESKQLSFFLFITLFITGLSVNRVNAQELDIQKPDISKSLTEVIFETSKGTFTLKLDPVKAPKTVANFLSYVDEGFYDNTIFHRVIPDFVIQGGGFKSDMNYKEPHPPVKNESSNRLKNLAGTISMARKTHPDTATSQFYINLNHNASLDYKSDLQPGYTVFGNISKGMEVLEKIASVQTGTMDRYRDVPKDDITLISVKRVAGKVAKADGAKAGAVKQKKQPFIAGEHYVVLDKPVATRDSSKVEVVELFAYGCPHCYEFEPLVKGWEQQQGNDVDFWVFPAVWNEPMKLFAQAFYTAQELDVLDKIHRPLFTALVIEQKNIRNETDVTNFFVMHGVDEKDFSTAFNSMAVESLVRQAEQRVRSYKPAGAPEIIVNGKYRIDRMRAGGQEEMLAVVDFLVEKERASMGGVK